MKNILAVLLFLASAARLASAQDANLMEGQDKPKTIEEKFEDLRKSLPFDLHGGAYLWHYQPVDIPGAKGESSLYYAWLSLAAQVDDFGFYFEPHFRDTPLRPFFQSNIWVQEIYASWKMPYGLGTLKGGKEYSRFGRFWDGSFYGNLPYFDGLKLDPDIGFSLENTVAASKELSIEYSLQYFVNDGRTNGSLANATGTSARDTIGDQASRQRNSFVARVAPTYKFADDLSLTLGVSGQVFHADFPGNENEEVDRGAVEGAVSWGPLTVFMEVALQNGHHVLNYPTPGDPSDHNHYVMSGATYTWDKLTFRYDYSAAAYDNRIREQMHMPAVVAAVHKHLSIWFEYVYWRQAQPGHDVTFDRSANIVLDIHF